MKRNRTLIIGTVTTPTRADSDLGHSYVDSQLYSNMNDPMIKYKPIPYPSDKPSAKEDILIDDCHTLLPNLCESWSNSPDHKSVVFTLRRGIRGHWGNELTTADIRYTIDRGFAIKASIFYWLTALAGLVSPEDCRIIDKYTFELMTPNSTGLTTKLMCSPWIPQLDHVTARNHAAERDPWSMKWMARNSCSWGPYRVVEWTEGSHVTLEAIDGYWRGRPRTERVISKAVPEREKRVALLERGEIDVAEGLLPRDIEYLRERDSIRVMSTGSTGVYYILMNCQMKPFDDLRVRRAMNYACPQKEIISRVFRGLAEPMDSPCSPLQPGYTGEFWGYEYNPDEAAKLLSQAGYPNGFEVVLCFTENSPAEGEVCAIMQEALRKIGINVKLRMLPVAVFNEKMYKKELLFASKFTFTAVRDPSYWGLWFRSGTFLNYQDLRDPELDTLLDKQASLLDAKERQEFSKNVQKRIVDLAPMVFVAYPMTNNAMRADIGGHYHFSPDCISYYWYDLDKR